ncbi:MAG: hypothetical protein HUJ22_03895 [Gracilimonas sp.]|uniref:hypothetical protein n=1 Tax=Gracilimonas sp. TaxID=1974203 RepID=UPI0019BBD5A5|nr:hypothetical protein [Gracilimonas sp.]MBD3615692.1 hypothetical protein [Gracilimonas sp.]
MGNRELLLVILVVVLIAISIGVAVQTISSGENSPNRAAILQGINVAIGRSIAYYERPEVYGGGANSFAEITFKDLLMDSVTGHGTYEITNRSHTSYTLIGRPNNVDQELRVVIYRDSVDWQTAY